MRESSIRQAKRTRKRSLRQIEMTRRGVKNRLEAVLTRSKWNRRQFLRSTAAAAGALTLSSQPVMAQEDGIELRTLFFNFTHLGPRKSPLKAVIGGTVYTLSPVHNSHPALLKARQTNSFLQQIPSSLLTHVLEDVPLPATQVAMHYTLTDADPATGTWSMPSIFMTIPKSALTNAFEVRTTLLGDAPVPISAKRELYGIGPAMTLQDLWTSRTLWTPPITPPRWCFLIRRFSA